MMKLTWKKQNQNKYKNKKRPLSHFQNLPFEQQQEDDTNNIINLQKEEIGGNDVVARNTSVSDENMDTKKLAQLYVEQGNSLAEDGKFSEALGKWEAALTLTPERAGLHEQKAQVLLELGEAWSAIKAASRATELEPTWAEAWITLGRAQLNFGEPDSAIESFDRALGIKPDSVEACDDRKTALLLTKRRKQLHTSGLSANMNRFAVGENEDLP
ncbi:hypothetical protein ACH5RR_034149 [Cinchona calisaya]|uniref:Tetratricopeptide repeat protein 33 n=1 Tax=Cinchona calisaya TaxID=153742 RepID=A0ABD2YBE8_9GENT